MDLQARVDKGVAWMDENVPNWFKRVDLEILNIASSEACICGQLQLWSRLSQLSEELGLFLPVNKDRNLENLEEELERTGKDYAQLTEMWRTAILERRFKEQDQTIRVSVEEV